MAITIIRMRTVVVLFPPLEPVLVPSFSMDFELLWVWLVLSCVEVVWVDAPPPVAGVLVFVLVPVLVSCEEVPVV